MDSMSKRAIRKRQRENLWLDAAINHELGFGPDPGPAPKPSGRKHRSAKVRHCPFTARLL